MIVAVCQLRTETEQAVTMEKAARMVREADYEALPAPLAEALRVLKARLLRRLLVIAPCRGAPELIQRRGAPSFRHKPPPFAQKISIHYIAA